MYTRGAYKNVYKTDGEVTEQQAHRWLRAKKSSKSMVASSACSAAEDAENCRESRESETYGESLVTAGTGLSYFEEM